VRGILLWAVSPISWTACNEAEDSTRVIAIKLLFRMKSSIAQCTTSATCPQLKEIEDECKAHVGKALGVFSKEVPLEQARPIRGLRAVFGEVLPFNLPPFRL